MCMFASESASDEVTFQFPLGVLKTDIGLFTLNSEKDESTQKWLKSEVCLSFCKITSPEHIVLPPNWGRRCSPSITHPHQGMFCFKIRSMPGNGAVIFGTEDSSTEMDCVLSRGESLQLLTTSDKLSFRSFWIVLVWPVGECFCPIKQKHCQRIHVIKQTQKTAWLCFLSLERRETFLTKWKWEHKWFLPQTTTEALQLWFPHTNGSDLVTKGRAKNNNPGFLSKSPWLDDTMVSLSDSSFMCHYHQNAILGSARSRCGKLTGPPWYIAVMITRPWASSLRSWPAGTGETPWVACKWWWSNYCLINILQWRDLFACGGSWPEVI